MTDTASVIGVWTTASRQRVSVWDAGQGRTSSSGPFRQVSRLGNPLVNEVLIPLGKKDLWNTLPPTDDKRFAYRRPPRAGRAAARALPGRVPEPGKLVDAGPPAPTWRRSCSPASRPASSRASRTTPARCRRTCSGSTPRSRPSKNPNALGVIGGDLAGFPNGRRVFDDVVTIELRAIAGVTVPLVDPAYKPDAAAGLSPTG